MTALHKAGDLDDVNNYRLISVLPVLSKIIEHHIHDHLTEYLNVHDLIYKNQSGFREQFGTETALAYIADTAIQNGQKPYQSLDNIKAWLFPYCTQKLGGCLSSMALITLA